MIAPSRLAVIRACEAVFGRGERCPEQWNQSLNPADATLAHAILGKIFRHWGKIQAYVDEALTRSDKNLPLETRITLALGLSQLAWLSGVADYAAVNESVTWISDPHQGFPAHQGLVNAILRQAARERTSLAEKIEAYPHYLDQSLFTKHALRHALGPDFSPTHSQSLWRQWNQPPRFCFRILETSRPLPEGLIPDAMLEGCWRLDEGAAFPSEWLLQNHGMVQDRSSQALLSFNWDRPVQTILDLCAAPGGKSTGLHFNYPEAQLTCIEKHPKKAEKLKSTLESRKIEGSVITADARVWLSEGDDQFDLIWLDAPCSASGTLQKHPDLTWIGDHIDLELLCKTQEELLSAALPRLSPGGLLVYSVCSWFPQEGIDHQKTLLERFAHLQPVTIWSPTLGGSTFQLKPLEWEGEGFQGFALSPR